MLHRFALYIAYNELRGVQTLQELNGIFLMRKTMVQFAFEHRGITRIHSDEIGKNAIRRRCTEVLYLAFFLYNKTNGNTLYTTGRKTCRHFLPKYRR